LLHRVNASLTLLLVRRGLSSAGVIVAVAALVFVLVRALPGDPVTAILGEQAAAVDRDALTRCLRLDEPLWRQAVGYGGDLLSGSFGRFCNDPSRTVADELRRVLPSTLALAASSLLLAVALAVPAGVAAAMRPRRPIDMSILLATLVGLAVPSFWLGPMLLMGLAWLLRFTATPSELLLQGLDLALPAATLATALAARLTRVTRASMLDVTRAAYVQAARARGLTEWRVVFRHALRNALVPVISVLGLQLGGLLAGAVVVEKVFSRPGVGSLLLDAIYQRNYALVQGCVLVMAMGFVVASLLADIGYALADPRLRGNPERR
jgi:peptide/nickel transport system permease protein